MKYFYSTRRDRNSDKLTVSYGKEAQREKYAKGGKYEDGVWFASPKDGDIKGGLSKTDGDFIMRSILTNHGTPVPINPADNPFEVWAVGLDKKWVCLGKFENYSAANTTMKNSIKQFVKIFVLEHKPSEEEEDADDTPPWNTDDEDLSID